MDVTSQQPAGGGMMKPPGGTYGEVAELDKLKQDLTPPAPPGQSGGPGPQPTPPAPGMPQGTRMPAAAKPGSVPDILLGPTQQPDTPQFTPLAPSGPAPGAVSANQRRLAVLDALAQSQEVSEETREWAQLVLQKLASTQA